MPAEESRTEDACRRGDRADRHCYEGDGRRQDTDGEQQCFAHSTDWRDSLASRSRAARNSAVAARAVAATGSLARLQDSASANARASGKGVSEPVSAASRGLR